MYFMLRVPITYLSVFERKGMDKCRGEDVNVVHECIDNFIPTEDDVCICSRSQLKYEYNYRQTISAMYTIFTR